MTILRAHRDEIPALAGPFRPLFDVYATGATLPAGGVKLRTTRAQLTFDEQRAPYGELQVDTPFDRELDGRLDPRVGVRLRVQAGYWIGRRRDTLDVGSYGLRLIGDQTPEGTSELVAQTDEALVTDSAPSRNTATRAAASHVAMITSLLGDVFPAPSVVSSTAAGAAISWPAGTLSDKWRSIEDLADSLGDAWVYADEWRRWIVTPRPTLAATADVEFAHPLVPSVPILSESGQRQRDSWANRVYLRYQWTPTGGAETIVESIVSVNSGPYAATLGNVRTYYEQRDVPTTQAKADTAATSILRRLSSRGRLLQFRAPALWWLRPGHTVGVRGARQLVTRVMFDSRGWMEVATRYPDPYSETIGA